VYTNTNSQALTGDSNTRFQDQLKVSDRITIRGMTHTVTSILSQNSLTFNPPYRGASNIPSTAPVKACKIRELRFPQSQWNRDTMDGNGPSGYAIDLTRMQMFGIQYTWYGAGFVDFMIRGVNGAWTMVHRIPNNNVNDEAYMRTGNMPVRYEIINENTVCTSLLAGAIAGSGDTSFQITETSSNVAAWWPQTGTVLIDQELIYYGSVSGNVFSTLTRAATFNYNIADTAKTFSGAAAGAHAIGNTVNLVSCTCSPSLTHWGSAFIMDGQFDQDRGYYFNFQNNYTTSITSGSSVPLFFLRLSPSVSNGITGDIGIRDLLNRAQILLQKLDVIDFSGASGGVVNIQGILNPSGFEGSTFTWNAINSVGQGGQPSFAQYSTTWTGGTYTAGSGERIFSTICNGGSQWSIDLSSLKELSNAVIGGNRMFPDGPDTLMIYATAINQTITSTVLNLYWSEAQA
jgi:hypothetical protein